MTEAHQLTNDTKEPISTAARHLCRDVGYGHFPLAVTTNRVGSAGATTYEHFSVRTERTESLCTANMNGPFNLGGWARRIDHVALLQCQAVFRALSDSARRRETLP